VKALVKIEAIALCAVLFCGCVAIKPSLEEQSDYQKGKQALEDENYAKGYTLYKKACDVDKSAEACYELGRAYYKGIGLWELQKVAKEFYEKGCKLGEKRACEEIAKLNEQAPKDYERGFEADDRGDDRTAIELYSRSCDANYLKACNALGYKYFEDKDRKTYSKAAELFGRACDGGEISACANLGRAYYMGMGVKQDYAKAYKLYEKACADGERVSCANLANAYQTGDGVKRDLLKAYDLHAKACNLNDLGACYDLISLYSDDLKDKSARDPARYFNKLCELGYEDMCQER
jgi:TPR repeat protein